VQVDQINLCGTVERYIVFKTSGSIKERTETSSEMGAGCQRNSLVVGVGRGEEVCRKGCPHIRQLSNGWHDITGHENARHIKQDMKL